MPRYASEAGKTKKHNVVSRVSNQIFSRGSMPRYASVAGKTKKPIAVSRVSDPQ